MNQNVELKQENSRNPHPVVFVVIDGIVEPDVVVHTFESQRLGNRKRRISKFEASFICRVSSKTAKATQRNPVSKKEKDFFFLSM